MRVLFLSVGGGLGGAERLLLDALASLRGAAETHVVVAEPGPLAERAASLGAGVTVLPMPDALLASGDFALRGRFASLLAIPATFTYAGQLRRLVRRLRPDVVHSNGLKFHLLTALAGLPRRQVVWHLHDFLGRRPLMSRALRWASFRAAGAIAVSDAVRRDAGLRIPITVVPNAVDTAHFRPGPADAFPPLADGTLRVGLVATFARWKGHDVFLDAATRLTREGLPVRFHVVGGPIYRTAGSQWSLDELKAIAPPSVEFTPFQSDPAPVYRSLDVVVHASTLPEPFGLTIVEAMACGRAVIVSRGGGAAELFTDGHDALGVPPGDADALSAALRRLIADADLRRRLGANARETALARFDRARLGGQLLAAYNAFRPAPAQEASR